MPSLAVILLLAAASWTTVRCISSIQRRRRLPPGPPGWPLIGSILEWPKSKKWMTFSAWAREYGDLTYVNLLGMDVLIVNTLETARALFDARSADFSDRPSLFFVSDIVGWRDLPVFQNWGPNVKLHRRLVHESIGTVRLVEDMEPKNREHTYRCIRRIIDEPAQMLAHLRTLSCAGILNVSHGYDVKVANDKFVALAEAVAADLSRGVAPGAFLVDLIPALNYLPAWFPGTGFKKTAEGMRELRERFMNEPYNWAVGEIAAGRGRPSYISTFIAGKDLTLDEQRTLQWGTTLLFLAATDTTSAANAVFVLCMLLNPDAQRRVQAELDSVLGSGPDRLPTLADRERLPYLNACIWEAMRWHPVAPEGMAHVARIDSTHNGHFIPKGTVLSPNIWAFAHNPETYKDPFAFRPERFLEPSSEPLPEFVFGFGRRVCAGQTVAHASMFTFAANLLALCSVQRAKGPDGKDLEFEVRFTGTVTTAPQPFPCAIESRSKSALSLLEAALASIEDD